MPISLIDSSLESVIKKKTGLHFIKSNSNAGMLRTEEWSLGEIFKMDDESEVIFIANPYVYLTENRLRAINGAVEVANRWLRKRKEGNLSTSF